MASFLNELYMSAPPYASDVLDDLQFVLDLHYTTLPEMVTRVRSNMCIRIARETHLC